MALEETLRMTKPRILIPRNIAYIECLWDTLERREELANLLIDNVDLGGRFIRLWTKVKSRKGKRFETKKLLGWSRKALETYIKEDRSKLARPNYPFEFIKTKGTQWKSNSVGSFFKRLSTRLPFKVSAHAYRVGGATFASENSVPDRLIMIQGGWEKWETLKRYTTEASLNTYAELLEGGNDKSK